VREKKPSGVKINVLSTLCFGSLFSLELGKQKLQNSFEMLERRYGTGMIPYRVSGTVSLLQGRIFI
jgi:hypothetical protein